MFERKLCVYSSSFAQREGTDRGRLGARAHPREEEDSGGLQKEKLEENKIKKKKEKEEKKKIRAPAVCMCVRAAS